MSDRPGRAGVAARFGELHGRPPDGVFSAPGRVTLIGEHTDHNEGHVLPFAIDRRCRVAAGRRDDDAVTVRSAAVADPGVRTTLGRLRSTRGWAAYVTGTLWAVHEAGVQPAGWDLVVDGDVPLGAGLSSSAALECAVALAVATLAGAGLDRLALARAARRGENEVVGVPVGILDQAASLLCGPAAALLLDCRTLDHEEVPLDLAAAGLGTLVVDTGVRHALADGGYAERRAACVAAAAALGVPALRDADESAVARLEDPLRRRARHVVTEQARVVRVVAALRDGRTADLGPELTASHASLRDDFAVSTAELDTAVEAALGAGALGARLVGGGFGGSVLVLARLDEAPAVGDAVASAFARARWTPPTIREVRPSAGAARDD